MLKIDLIIMAAISFSVSIYSISATDIEGQVIHFSDFSGKKILLVNTATNSSYVSQYSGLEQLYQTYKDSLIVIAIPSDSFGNEPGSNQTIKDFVTTTYNTHFVLGEKAAIKGPGSASIYQWLTEESMNGVMDNEVVGDFQKFLISKDGNLIGVFSPMVEPMDSLIQNALLHN